MPDNLSSDSFALKMVKRAIQEELTQARARIKKMVRKFVYSSRIFSTSNFTDQGESRNIAQRVG
jgi:uncharacterized protein (DUF924 family)